MAFNKSFFGKSSAGANTGQVNNMWSYYSSSDTVATITGGGYFNDVADLLEQNDVIWVHGSDDADFIRTTSAITVTPVTTAKITGGAENIPLPQGNILVGNPSGIATTLPANTNNTVLGGNGTTLEVKKVGSAMLDNSTIKAFPRFFGSVNWTGGLATLAETVTGVTASMGVIASFFNEPTEPAYIVKVVPTTDTITFTLSDPNTSNDAQLQYVVFESVV